MSDQNLIQKENKVEIKLWGQKKDGSWVFSQANQNNQRSTHEITINTWDIKKIDKKPNDHLYLGHTYIDLYDAVQVAKDVNNFIQSHADYKAKKMAENAAKENN